MDDFLDHIKSILTFIYKSTLDNVLLNDSDDINHINIKYIDKYKLEIVSDGNLLFICEYWENSGLSSLWEHITANEFIRITPKTFDDYVVNKHAYIVLSELLKMLESLGYDIRYQEEDFSIFVSCIKTDMGSNDTLVIEIKK